MLTKEYTFDLSRIRTLEDWWDLYTEVVRGNGWEMFGRNRDAYRDSLAGGPGCPLSPCRFVFVGVSSLSAKRLREITKEELQLKMSQCHPSHIPHIKMQLELLEYGKGETILDWILKPLYETGDIEVLVKGSA